MSLIKKIIYLSVLFPLIAYTQSTIEKERIKYCKKDCKKYVNDLQLLRNGEIYPIFNNKFYKRFSIPKSERLKLYPFNEFDSIYVTNPVFINGVDEKRNYLDDKFHNSKRLLTVSEKIELSKILFNYSKIDIFTKTGLFTPENEYGCIQDRYPKIILLFMKNGKFEKYIAFPDKGFERYNFKSEDYWKYFDWSYEKEDMILEMFKKDIIPEEKCKK